MNRIILASLLTVATGAPQYAPAPPPQYSNPAPSYGPAPVPILRDDRQGPDAYGSYSFNFETGDGIYRNEQGSQGSQGAVATQGGWSFTFPDGTPGVFSFVADENGYRVESDLLPTPHPLPAHAIAQIEKARREDAAGNQYPAPPPSNQYTQSGPPPSNQYTQSGPPPSNQYTQPAPPPQPQYVIYSQ